MTYLLIKRDSKPNDTLKKLAASRQDVSFLKTLKLSFAFLWIQASLEKTLIHDIFTLSGKKKFDLAIILRLPLYTAVALKRTSIHLYEHKKKKKRMCNKILTYITIIKRKK